jgi:hypothetical protein
LLNKLLLIPFSPCFSLAEAGAEGDFLGEGKFEEGFFFRVFMLIRPVSYDTMNRDTP